MPRLKKDIFCRGVRMQHQFGELAESQRNDQFIRSTEVFEAPWPKRVDELSKPGKCYEVQQYGQYGYRPEYAAVEKANNKLATIDGKVPDTAQAFAMPIPVGTKRRLGPLKTDK